jgi:(E)-4-hydroxy-3-methylbut-2-enyl-diphosphate synthase
MERAKATRDAARRAAEEDRRHNLDDRGDDANASEQLVELLRKQRS